MKNVEQRRTVYGEVDLSKVRTVPIAERMQGWSAHAHAIGKANPTAPPPCHCVDPRMHPPYSDDDRYVDY